MSFTFIFGRLGWALIVSCRENEKGNPSRTQFYVRFDKMPAMIPCHEWNPILERRRAKTTNCCAHSAEIDISVLLGLSKSRSKAFEKHNPIVLTDISVKDFQWKWKQFQISFSFEIQHQMIPRTAFHLCNEKISNILTLSRKLTTNLGWSKLGYILYKCFQIHTKIK